MAQALLGELLRLLRRTGAAGQSPDETDGALLNRFLERREEDAFALLVQRHGPMVLSVCQRVLSDGHAAEDSFQATFLVLVRRAASIRKKDSVASWLYAVAQRIALRARSQTAAAQRLPVQTADKPSAEPLDDLARQELHAVLDEEIGAL